MYKFVLLYIFRFDMNHASKSLNILLITKSIYIFKGFKSSPTNFLVGTVIIIILHLFSIAR